MPAQLRDIKVDFVSLVDRAAVRDPQNKSEPRRFLLFKREGATDPTTSEGGDHMSGTTAEVDAALEKAQDGIAEIIKQAQEEGVDVSKLQAQGPTPAPGDDPTKKDGLIDPKTPTGKSTSDGGQEGSDTGNGVSKADLSPEVRAVVEKAERAEADANARIEKAEKAAEAAGDIAKGERDARITAEFIAKAETTYGELPANPQELGPVLKRASEKLEKADYEYLEQVLKGANESVATGELFGEIGRGGVPNGDTAGDAFSALQKKAEEIRKSDSTIDEHAALEKAMKDNPDLQRDYLVEQRGSVR